MFLKCPRPGLYGIAAMVIILCALLFRVWLTAVGLPNTNSDEGAMGLEAMHIAFRGELPIFLYGQNYMGVLEAYIGAGAFHLFGVSLFSLRLSTLILFTLFLVSLYFLTGLLYTKKLALFTLLLLSFASSDMLNQQLRAVGGAVETLLFGTLTLLLASWLALGSSPQAKPPQNSRRLAAYACLGFVMGFGLWCHVLILPFLLAGLLLLLLFCRHELLTRWSLIMLAAFLIGVAPIIIHTLQNSAEQRLFDSMEPVAHTSNRYQSSYPCKEAQQHVSLWLASRDRPHTALHKPGTPNVWSRDSAHAAVRTRGWRMEPGLPGIASCSLPALGAAPLEGVAAKACTSPGLVIQRARDSYTAVCTSTAACIGHYHARILYHEPFDGPQTLEHALSSGPVDRYTCAHLASLVPIGS